jgi:hypothetical protein
MAEHHREPYTDPNLSPPTHAAYPVSNSRPVSPLSPQSDSRPSPSYLTPSLNEFGHGPTSPPSYAPTSPPVIGGSVQPGLQRVPVGARQSYTSLGDEEEEDEPPRRYGSYTGAGNGQFERSTDRLNIDRGDTGTSIHSVASRRSKFESMCSK